MANALVTFWRKFEPKPGQLNVHPEDLDWLREQEGKPFNQAHESFPQFIHGTRFGNEEDAIPHLSLLPSPFHGDLNRADIFILLMNPGFSASDYYADQDPSFRSHTIANLRQRGINPKFPYFSLNPEFVWSGAFQWIESRMRPILHAIQEKHCCSYYDALSTLSRRLAVVELFPYHSANGRAIPSGVWKELPSVKQAKTFVSEELLKPGSNYLVVLARSHEKWDLPKRRISNLVECAKGRGITFNPKLIGEKASAGKAILAKLGCD